MSGLDFVPPKELIFVGPQDREQFRRIGEEFFRYLVELGGLKPDDAVLDVGCGIGRIAGPLTRYVSSEGSYDGFDVVEKGVSWCQEQITTHYPHFRFRHVDLFNGRYNPKGSLDPAEFSFPYPSNNFDFVFLISVFTHLLPAAVRRYLGECRRVLRPGGMMFSTFFLLDETARRSIEEGRSRFSFAHRLESSHLEDPGEPEAAVAYDEHVVRWLYNGAGLTVLEPIFWGNWSGRPESLSLQDIVLAR